MGYAVLGPILFLIYINNLEDDISSKVLKFAPHLQMMSFYTETGVIHTVYTYHGRRISTNSNTLGESFNNKTDNVGLQQEIKF